MTSKSDRSFSRPELGLEEVYRAEWGRLLSLLASRTRRLDLVEDPLSEAFVRAAERWPIDGAPNNPAGWLGTVAHREVLDRLRAEATAGRKAALLVLRPEEMSTADPGEPMADDRLHLILLCCHPALPRQSRSALALRLVLGIPTEHIARLFLVSTPTMAARLTRAKRKIVLAGVPLRSPVGDELRSRLDEFCRTIYLAFTAAYAPHSGPELLLVDRAGDGVQLATVLHHLAPEALQVRAARPPVCRTSSSCGCPLGRALSVDQEPHDDADRDVPAAAALARLWMPETSRRADRSLVPRVRLAIGLLYADGGCSHVSGWPDSVASGGWPCPASCVRGATYRRDAARSWSGLSSHAEEPPVKKPDQQCRCCELKQPDLGTNGVCFTCWPHADAADMAKSRFHFQMWREAAGAVKRRLEGRIAAL